MPISVFRTAMGAGVLGLAAFVMVRDTDGLSGCRYTEPNGSISIDFEDQQAHILTPVSTRDYAYRATRDTITLTSAADQIVLHRRPDGSLTWPLFGEFKKSTCAAPPCHPKPR